MSNAQWAVNDNRQRAVNNVRRVVGYGQCTMHNSERRTTNKENEQWTLFCSLRTVKGERPTNNKDRVQMNNGW